MRYNTQTNDLIRASGEKARLLGHSYVGTVHILLALLEQPGEVGLLLRSLGAEPELAGTMVQLQYGTGTPDLPLPQGLTKKARELLRMAAPGGGGARWPGRSPRCRSSPPCRRCSAAVHPSRPTRRPVPRRCCG